MMKVFILQLFIAALSINHLYAQSKSGIEVIDTRNLSFEVDTLSYGNIMNRPDKSWPKRVITPAMERQTQRIRPKLSKKLRSKRLEKPYHILFQVKATFVNAVTKKPLNKVRICLLTMENFFPEETVYHVLWNDRLHVNKKGKITWDKRFTIVKEYDFYNDSIYSYAFLHEGMEPYAVNIDLRHFPKGTINLDTIFMKPLIKENVKAKQ